MAFPTSWPPRQSSGIRSIRFYVTGTATSNYTDNGFMFGDAQQARNVTPLPYVPPGGERTTVAVPNTPQGGGRDPHDNQPTAAPPPQVWAKSILIVNAGGTDLTFTFDGTNDHGVVKANSERVYRSRYESGIAVKGAGVFSIEAW